MSPDRLEKCLSIIRWAPETLAHALECDVSLIDAWRAGTAEMPSRTAAWIEALAALHEEAETIRPKSHKGKSFKPSHAGVRHH